MNYKKINKGKSNQLIKIITIKKNIKFMILFLITISLTQSVPFL